MLRPPWSIVVIREAWDGRNSDLLLLQLPVILALHTAAFFSLRYATAGLVVCSTVFVGLVLAIVAGVQSNNDSVLSGWLVFQLVMAAAATVGGAYVFEFRQRLYVISYAAARKAEAEANDIVSNLLPAQIVKRIVAGEDVQSQVHTGVAILVRVATLVICDATYTCSLCFAVRRSRRVYQDERPDRTGYAHGLLEWHIQPL